MTKKYILPVTEALKHNDKLEFIVTMDEKVLTLFRMGFFGAAHG